MSEDPGMTDEGGDPACWLNRVCTECGLFLEDPAAPTCPRCGSPIVIA